MAVDDKQIVEMILQLSKILEEIEKRLSRLEAIFLKQVDLMRKEIEETEGNANNDFCDGYY